MLPIKGGNGLLIFFAGVKKCESEIRIRSSQKL